MEPLRKDKIFCRKFLIEMNSPDSVIDIKKKNIYSNKQEKIIDVIREKNIFIEKKNIYDLKD